MRKIFPILALAMFCSNLGIGIVSPLLSIYAEQMGASAVWIGLVMASYSIANIFSTPLFGRLSDGRNRKIFLTLGLLAYSLISLGYIFSNNIYTLALTRLLHGASAGMVLPIANACIGDLSPKNEEGKWMGYSNAAFYAGFGAGPLAGGILSQYFGMTTTFAFMCGLNLIAFLVVLFRLPEIQPRTVSKAVPRTPLKTIIRSHKVLGLFSYQVTAAMGQGCYSAFLPILVSFKGMSLTVIGILISVTLGLTSLLGSVTGTIADRLNKRVMVCCGTVVIVTALVLIPSTNSFWQLLVLAILLALGAATTMPAISAMGVVEGRKFGMGATMGLVTMGMNIGFAIGPVIEGKVVDMSSTPFAFYFAGSAVCLGLIPFLWYTRSRVTQPSVTTEAKDSPD